MGRYDALLQEEVKIPTHPPAEQSPSAAPEKVRAKSPLDLAPLPIDALKASPTPEVGTAATGPVSEPVQNERTQEINEKQKTAGKPASHSASLLASYRASMIDDIRRRVKSLGKEVSFVRLTPEEKNQLVDLVYSYKRQGIKISENEVNRIAINLLLADYRANGTASVLARVIAALLA